MHDDSKIQTVALVTGASSGIGRLTAARLAQRGYRVFGTSRSPRADSPGCEMLCLDVDSEDSVSACTRALLERAGRVDLIVNNAGRALVGACEETGAEEARALFETNFFGVMRIVSALLPGMRERRSGAVVNVGSVSGYFGTPFHGVYAASKHALAGYTEALRYELEPFGVRVALVEPAAHRTGIAMEHPRELLDCYDAPRKRVEQTIRGQIEHGDDPERIVDAIVAAATSRAPRLRYRVGGTARLLAIGRRFLSEAQLARFVRRELGLLDA